MRITKELPLASRLQSLQLRLRELTHQRQTLAETKTRALLQGDTDMMDNCRWRIDSVNDAINVHQVELKALQKSHHLKP
jgi:hypothetical protein